MNKKYRAMKISTKITVLLVIALLFSLNIFATGFDFEDEQYIDDIPFNIEEVEMQARYEQAISVDFMLTEEESYIGDIPFNVEEIAEQARFEMAIATDFTFSDEEYIDDIPFASSPVNQKTSEKIYAKALLK